MRPYKRKPGEFEIRILPDGRVFMPAPDDAILELARDLKLPGGQQTSKEKPKKNERAKTRRTRKKTG